VQQFYSLSISPPKSLPYAIVADRTLALHRLPTPTAAIPTSAAPIHTRL
jgi:hypothetical protein